MFGVVHFFAALAIVCFVNQGVVAQEKQLTSGRLLPSKKACKLPSGYDIDVYGVAIFPSGVISIPDNAFEGCVTLTTIVIPDTVISIGSYAFYGCSALSIATIGTNVVSIGTSAFVTTALVCLNYPSGIIPDQPNPQYCTVGEFFYCGYNQKVHATSAHSCLLLFFSLMQIDVIGCYPTAIVLITNSGWGIASNGVAIVPIGVTKVTSPSTRPLTHILLINITS